MSDFKQKYIKYKSKYLALKHRIVGGVTPEKEVSIKCIYSSNKGKTSEIEWCRHPSAVLKINTPIVTWIDVINAINKRLKTSIDPKTITKITVRDSNNNKIILSQSQLSSQLRQSDFNLNRIKIFIE